MREQPKWKTTVLKATTSLLLLGSIVSVPGLGVENEAKAGLTTTKAYVTNTDKPSGTLESVTTSDIFITTNTIKEDKTQHIGFLYKTTATKKLYDKKNKVIDTIPKDTYIYFEKDSLLARKGGSTKVGKLKNKKNLERIYNELDPVALADKYDFAGNYLKRFDIKPITTRINNYRQSLGKGTVSTNQKLTFTLALGLDYEARADKGTLELDEALTGAIIDTWGDIYANARSEKAIKKNMMISRFVTRKELSEKAIAEKFLSKTDVQKFLKAPGKVVYSFSVQPVLATGNVGIPTTSYEYTIVFFRVSS